MDRATFWAIFSQRNPVTLQSIYLKATQQSSDEQLFRLIAKLIKDEFEFPRHPIQKKIMKFFF
jgi:hypothetical protein